MKTTEELSSRSYGTHGPLVYVLHGGPAAAGAVRPIAAGLAESFRVIEPFQKGSSQLPLTVATHVADLDRLIRARTDPTRPVIVGHSWGAMLALAYAAAYPDRVRGIVCVGCGTFDTVSRQTMRAIIYQRIDERTRLLLAELPTRYPDPGDRLRAEHALLRRAYDYAADEPTIDNCEVPPLDVKAYTETWNDMLRLQNDGTYPQAFTAIAAPVLMIQGSYDPHPGKMIYEALKPHIRHIEYVELDRCGHEPWRERFAKEEFFREMKGWITNCTAASTA